MEVALSSALKQDTKYRLVIAKSINPNLSQDVTIDYTTAPALAIREFTYVGNTAACVYLSNDLYEWGYPNTPEEEKSHLAAVSLTPKALIRSFSKYQAPYD